MSQLSQAENAQPQISHVETKFDYSGIVALNLPLHGIHLIEASAGTGKTWTLSVYLVRLMVEKHYQTRQIIVTTFTRAAAAELKQRIREDFEKTKHWLAHPQQANMTDPLARYIFQKLTIDQQAHAMHLLQLALDTFDELFVGTLDSFCQKMLHEFAFDSGQYERLQISEKEKELCYQILHDALRQWRTKQDPRLIELLVLNNSLLEVDDFERIAQTTLNFLAADIEAVSEPQLDWQQWIDFAEQLAQLDVSTLHDFLHVDGQFHAKLTKNRAFTNNSHVFPQIIEDIKTQIKERHGLLHLDDSQSKWWEGLSKIDGHFKKGDDALKAAFLQNSAVKTLLQIYERVEQLKKNLDGINRYLKYLLSQTLRQQLTPQLIERGETTFAQQMRLLGDALHGETGQALAQHIVHRYPVIMVDEFQDTNADQDRVIANVWRQSELAERISLILVGDPKQAIYGFRGGDMLTYQKAKSHVLTIGKQHHLTFNQRSIAPLVAAVDRLFRFNQEFGEQVIYEPVTASGRNTRQLLDHHVTNQEIVNPTPLRLVALQDKQDEYQQIAWQIIHLLKQSHDGELYFDDQQQKIAVEPQDIAVLCPSNAELEKVHYFLSQADIPVWRGAETSVFEGELARDFAAILQAMLTPQHEGYLRRALASLYIGMTVADFNRMDQQDDLLGQYQAKFSELGALWLKRGFLSAWQQFLSWFDVWQTLAQQPNSERHIVNLRHLVELIYQQSEKITGQHHLLAWLMAQISHPRRHEHELERRLASQQGVQLMTIHKSKGLEFPIVFVGGLDKKKEPKEDVIFAEKDQQRLLSFDQQSKSHMAEHQSRHDAEQRRLIYVALTRASLRLYLTIKPNDDEKTAKHLIRYWLKGARDTWQDANTVLQQALTQLPDFKYQAKNSLQIIEAKPLPQLQIQQWAKTSFSQLINHGSVVKLPSAIEDEPEQLSNIHDDEATEPLTNQATVTTEIDTDQSDNIVTEMRYMFPRGANAGECLHQILEHLEPQKDQQHWFDCVQHYSERFGVDQVYKQYQQQTIDYERVVEWMRHIHHAKLPNDTTLATLSLQVHEFEFYLGLNEAALKVEAIQQKLQQYGIVISELNVVRTVKYLKGFIDLVYEHQGKYYIADYKSNYLGDQLRDYGVDQLKDSMSHAGYWLQAAIYLVALHRYLTVRLKQHYQPEHHLGGAVYLYLRGMQADSDQTGVLFWQPDLQLIFELDDLFGYDTFAHNKAGNNKGRA